MVGFRLAVNDKAGWRFKGNARDEECKNMKKIVLAAPLESCALSDGEQALTTFISDCCATDTFGGSPHRSPDGIR